ARTLRAGIPHVWPKVGSLKVVLLFINHAIANIVAYGKKSQAAGGHALKLAASLRVEFKNEGEFLEAKEGKSDDERERYGQKVKVTFEKLKGGHLKKYTYDTLLLNSGGFDSIGQLLDACLEVGVIKKANKTTYTLVDRKDGTEHDSFTKAEWPAWVADHGGFDELYKWWLKHAKETKAIIPWGSTKE
ncbi:MAG: hypothetical protein ACRD32_07225, partial [Nitrososphaerales archaeon]